MPPPEDPLFYNLGCNVWMERLRLRGQKASHVAFRNSGFEAILEADPKKYSAPPGVWDPIFEAL